MRAGRLFWGCVGLLIVALAIAAGPAGAAPPPAGGLFPLPPGSDCVKERAAAGDCSNPALGLGLTNPRTMVVTPDGKNVYVAASTISGTANQGTIAAFSRDTATGALTQLPGTAACLTDSILISGDCPNNTAPGVAYASDIALAPGGAQVLTVGSQLIEDGNGSLYYSGNVATFNRSTDGTLVPNATQPCINDRGSTGPPLPGSSATGSCAATNAYGTMGALRLAISPNDGNGQQVYVTGYIVDDIAVLQRDPVSGLLSVTSTPGVDCIRDHEAAASPALYHGSYAQAPHISCNNNVAHGLIEPIAIAASPNGKYVYAAGSLQDSIDIFARGANGALTQLPLPGGCIMSTFGQSTNVGCDKTHGNLGVPEDIKVSPTSNIVYVASDLGAEGTAIRAWSVGADGTLTPGGCVASNATTGCTAVPALSGVYRMALAPDGHHLYATAFTTDSVFAFAVDPDSATIAPVKDGSNFACVQSTAGTPLACPRLGEGLHGVDSVAPSPDGLELYVGADTSSTVTAVGIEVPPTCSDASATTTAGKKVTVALPCTDANPGQTLTRSIVSQPAHGTLGAAADTVDYTPASGFRGTDTFTFRSSDGAEQSAPATATVTVNPAPPPPTGKLTIAKVQLKKKPKPVLVVTLVCPPDPAMNACTGKLGLSTAGKGKHKSLAKGKRFSLAARQTAVIKLTLNRLAKSLLKHGKRKPSIALIATTGAGPITVKRRL